MSIRDRAYLSAGGDFERRAGKEYWRLDVENHGLTAAFVTGYAVTFAKLAELQAEKKPRPPGGRIDLFDGVSPNGGRRQLPTSIVLPRGFDAVLGAVWYHDVFGGGERVAPFVLRIAARRDIPGHGLTRLDVGGIARDYAALRR